VTYADGSTITYTWDAGNALRQLTDSQAGTITRTYDLLDRLTQETTPQGSIGGFGVVWLLLYWWRRDFFQR